MTWTPDPRAFPPPPIAFLVCGECRRLHGIFDHCGVTDRQAAAPLTTCPLGHPFPAAGGAGLEGA